MSRSHHQLPKPPQVTPVLVEHKPIKKQPTKTHVDVLHYEELLAAEFERRGWQVIQWPTGRGKKPEVAPLAIVRQYHLVLSDPLAPSSPKSHYHLDFCLPHYKLNLEFDGYRGYGKAGRTQGGHNSWTGFHRDRRRDRLMEMAGWRVLRYGPMDLNSLDGVKNAVAAFEWLFACVEKEA